MMRILNGEERSSKVGYNKAIWAASTGLDSAVVWAQKKMMRHRGREEHLSERGDGV